MARSRPGAVARIRHLVFNTETLRLPRAALAGKGWDSSSPMGQRELYEIVR